MKWLPLMSLSQEAYWDNRMREDAVDAVLMHFSDDVVARILAHGGFREGPGQRMEFGFFTEGQR